jgi:hypothetical protein
VRWSLTLDGCGSSGAGEKIVSYDWTIRGVTVDGFEAHLSGEVCNLTLNNLPARGQYGVTLFVKTTSSASDSSAQLIEIKDWLIVSIGDSFSSGEGNPDRPGVYGADHIQGCQGKITHVEKRAVWKDRRCHRSALSAPALTAEQIERSDDQSSVTFLSFACSGAEIEPLISKRYRGQESPSPSDIGVLPQIAAIKAAVGDRPIDALLVTVGIDDLEFSSFMTKCALPHHGLIERVWGRRTIRALAADSSSVLRN